jgi:hypothetical protein
VIVLVVVLVGAFLYFKSGIVNFNIENMSADDPLLKYNGNPLSSYDKTKNPLPVPDGVKTINNIIYSDAEKLAGNIMILGNNILPASAVIGKNGLITNYEDDKKMITNSVMPKVSDSAAAQKLGPSGVKPIYKVDFGFNNYAGYLEKVESEKLKSKLYNTTDINGNLILSPSICSDAKKGVGAAAGLDICK